MTPKTTQQAKNLRMRPLCLMITAATFASGVACVDILVSVLSGPSELAVFAELPAPLASTAIVAFLVYLAVWALLSIAAARALRLSHIPLALSAAAFMIIAFVLFRLLPAGLSAVSLLRYTLVLSLSMVFSVTAYFPFLAWYKSETLNGWPVALALSAPLILSVVLLFAWLEIYWVGAPATIGTMLLALAFVASVALVIAAFVKLRSRVFVMSINLAVFLILCVSPAIRLVRPRPAETDKASFSAKHEIERVILIVVDTLRPDAMSCYGPLGTSTPNMDSLATDGLLFTTAISAGPWTLPGMASMFSGLSPWVHMTNGSTSALPDSVLTLAERLDGAGYRTAAIGKNIVLAPERNFCQGFQEYHWFPQPSDDNSFGKKVLRSVFPRAFSADVSTQEITDETISWLEANRDQDFFLWVHYYDPHHPFSPPPEFLPNSLPPDSMSTVFKSRKRVQSGTLVLSVEQRQWVRELYLGEVRYVDANLGTLFRALDRLGLYEGSLIVLTSDHGEEFWEHERFEHGHTLYDELLRVPLIIKLPSSSATGRVDTLVSTQNILPTVLELCGVDFDSTRIESGSLSGLWSSPLHSFDAKPIFSNGVLYFEDREAVVFEGLKYIRSRVTGREELFDLRHDPNEENSISRTEVETVNRLRGLLDQQIRHAAELKRRLGIVERDVRPDEETIRRLRSLGYI